MADVVQKGWERYLELLQKYPLRTKAISAGVLAYSSDALSQKIAGAKQLNYKRSLIIMLYGLLYAGPYGHYWHKLLDRLFPGKKDGTTIVKKVIVEQLTSNPLQNIIYMSFIGIMLEGRSLSSVKTKLQSEYPGVQLNSWKFWPIVSLINYRYIPISLRVLFANLAAICWANYVKWTVLSSSKVAIVNAGALKKAI